MEGFSKLGQGRAAARYKNQKFYVAPKKQNDHEKCNMQITKITPEHNIIDMRIQHESSGENTYDTYIPTYSKPRIKSRAVLTYKFVNIKKRPH